MKSYRALWQALAAEYDEREAKAVARLVMEECFGLSLTDLAIGKDTELLKNITRQRLLQTIATRLLKGEPVQHILGMASYCGRRFMVTPDVLIPRPETQQLNQMIDSFCKQRLHGQRILDIGTGSGCIAITAALDLQLLDARVTAWDISEAALPVARCNNKKLKAGVAFRQRDALHPPHHRQRWDVIVSNPPYICTSEQTEMTRQVLNHEPPIALFVPDDAPLRFYRAIAAYATTALTPGGALLFEVNSRHADAVARLLTDKGFAHAAIHQDCYGRQRFVSAYNGNH